MTLRVGIIGCGFIGAVHSFVLKALIKSAAVDAAVVATCDEVIGRAEGFARAHGAELATDDPTRLLAMVDAVWICTPTSSHLGLVGTAAAAGVAVFCEKPVGRSLEEATAVIAAAEKAGIPHQVGLVLRASPVFITLRDVIDSGRLGRPLAIVYRDDQYLPNQGQYASTWRTDVAIAGGGTLLEHSIHDLDVLSWMFGPVRDIAASVSYHADHPGIDNGAVVLLRFEGGASATLTSVWHQVLTRPSTRRVEVFCERGLAWLDEDFLGPLHVETNSGAEVHACAPPPWVDALPLDDARWRAAAGAYGEASRTFLEALAAGRRPFPGLDAALTAHRLVDAAYRAAQAGRWVDIALLH